MSEREEFSEVISFQWRQPLWIKYKKYASCFKRSKLKLFLSESIKPLIICIAYLNVLSASTGNKALIQ